MKMNYINKIEDFGQKIGGARKDYYTEAREAAAQYLTAANVETLKSCASLGALVKLPHLTTLTKNGAITAEAARAVLVLFRSIERKPARTFRAARWAEKTAPVLAQIADLLKGGEVSAEVSANVEFEVLTLAGWPASAFSFSTYSCDRVTPQSFAACYDRVGVIRIFHGSHIVARVASAADAVASINVLCEKDSARRADGPKLEAHKNRAGVWYIHPVGKREISIKTLEGVTDTNEVRRIMREERAELVARYKVLQSVPDLRRDWNRPRVGEDWRKGENITPEQFSQALPFRGVEFGNWVTQAERASLLNAAFDGFHDLAQLFGLSAEQMTLNSALAFAFASRGKAGAMAHYESLRQVINLTKKNGAGCMAHEWFHALDNWAQSREGRGGFATEAYSGTSAAERAGVELVRVIRGTEFYRRSQNLAAFKGDYWVKAVELAARGFESVCAFLLRVNGVCSDFLVNCLDLDEFTAKDTAHRSNFYPYPTEAEAAQLAPYYFAFLRAIFGEGVQMSEKVADEVAALTATAEKEHTEAQAERDAMHAAEEEKRAEMTAAAKTHAEALKAENRAKVEGRTAEVMQETGATWSHVFESCGKFYAVGGGRGFVFLVFYTGAISFRLLRVNNRIKRDFRGYSRYFIEYRAGVDLREAIGNDVILGLNSLSQMSDIFRHSYATTWAEFSAKFADELAAAQGEKQERNEIMAEESTDPTPTENTEAATAQDVAQTDTDAPAEGLQLVDTAEGVAVLGDSRTTYRNRKQIKAHGATWNKTAQQWQASEPEAVARLRAWFGVSTTPTIEEGDTAHESEQPGSENPLTALRARLYALNALGVEVYDLLTIAANISPESVGERALSSCALEVIQRLNSTADRRAAQMGVGATLCEPAEITDTETTDTAEDFADVLTADRLELLRSAAADFDRLTQAGEHIAAVKARLSALFACGVDVADLVQSVDYKADQYARHRAAVVLTADEFRTLYGFSKEEQPEDCCRVWQFERGTYNAINYELHEIRELGGVYSVLFNLCELYPEGSPFSVSYNTYEEAAANLEKLRPGVRLIAELAA